MTHTHVLPTKGVMSAITMWVVIADREGQGGFCSLVANCWRPEVRGAIFFPWREQKLFHCKHEYLSRNRLEFWGCDQTLLDLICVDTGMHVRDCRQTGIHICTKGTCTRFQLSRTCCSCTHWHHLAEILRSLCRVLGETDDVGHLWIRPSGLCKINSNAFHLASLIENFETLVENLFKTSGKNPLFLFFFFVFLINTSRRFGPPDPPHSITRSGLRHRAEKTRFVLGNKKRLQRKLAIPRMQNLANQRVEDPLDGLEILRCRGLTEKAIVLVCHLLTLILADSSARGKQAPKTYHLWLLFHRLDSKQIFKVKGKHKLTLVLFPVPVSLQVHFVSD